MRDNREYNDDSIKTACQSASRGTDRKQHNHEAEIQARRPELKVMKRALIS